VQGNEESKTGAEHDEGNDKVAVGKDTSGGFKKRHPSPVVYQAIVKQPASNDQAINRGQHTEASTTLST
jgi:hypothetical protein